jgi:hypothetical protein
MYDAHLEAGGAWLPDTMEIIGDAMKLETDAFQGVPAQAWLEVALEVVWGHGFHDDCAGATDTTGHVFRVGRHVLETDERGFKTVHSFGTIESAQELIDFVDDQNAEYAD